MSKPIRFKSPTDDVLYVTTTTGACARIGPKWRELPVELHAAAIAAGAVTDNMDKAAAEQQRAKVEAAPAEDAPEDPAKLIHTAIIELIESSDEGAFDKKGFPDLKYLSARVGFNVEREQMLKVWHAVEAEAAQQ